jgi:hypothetical protein
MAKSELERVRGERDRFRRECDGLRVMLREAIAQMSPAQFSAYRARLDAIDRETGVTHADNGAKDQH